MIRLALVILRKDLRRLWWEGAVGAAVAGALTYFDAQRYDFVPSPTEAMLNFLTPAVWAYLIAMLVHQEALVGDRQFWITRPYSRGALLLAKLLGAIALVHIPALISDCVILSSHHFHPLRSLPQLAWKQAIVAGAITVPALAIAAATRNLPQFAFGATLAALAGVLLAAGDYSAPWLRVERLPGIAALLTLGAGAMIVVVIQYKSRRTALARVTGAASGLAAALLFLYVPAGGSTNGGGEPGAISVELDTSRPGAIQSTWPGSTIRQVAIPIRMSGAPETPGLRFEQVDLRLTADSGAAWTMSRRRRWPGLSGSISRDSQVVFLTEAIYDRVAAHPVTIHGKLAAVLTETKAAVIPAQSAPSPVPGLGRCTSGPSAPRLWRVMCESPETIPQTHVFLRAGSEAIGRPQYLGDSAPFVRYPLTPWLSPLNRRQTFFHLREDGPAAVGDQWRVPAGAIGQADVHLEHYPEVRRVVAEYSLGPLRLTDYLPPGNRGSMNLR